MAFKTFISLVSACLAAISCTHLHDGGVKREIVFEVTVASNTRAAGNDGLRLPENEDIAVQGYSLPSDENTIEDSARNPLLLMDQNIQGPNYAYDWLYYEIDQLWGGKSMKTIYDPCHYGNKVPYDELETLFKAASYYYNNYIYFEGRVIGLGIRPGVLGSREEIFFPFTGWKGYEAGVPDKGHPWMNVGSVGDYQDARILLSGHHSSNRVASNGFSTSQSNRTASAPVRCVRYLNESR